MPNSAQTTSICVVCSEPVEAGMSAACNWCNGVYHLNQRNDVEAKDCGQVWIDEQYMALQFACDACLAAADRAPAQPPGRIREINMPRAPTQRRRRRYTRRA